MLKVENLTIGYNKTPLLSELNFEFHDKIYGILGKSGKGKSTFFKTLCGLLKPIQGQVTLNDVVIKHAGRNGIFMMHQSYTNFDWLTALDNILIAKSIRQRITNDDRNEALDLLQKVGLLEYHEHYPVQLSGGMRQRLALARTLFMKPPVLLMDEPLSALDAKTRESMQNLILDLHKETKNTIIMITHSDEEAQKMCGEIIHFN